MDKYKRWIEDEGTDADPNYEETLMNPQDILELAKKATPGPWEEIENIAGLKIVFGKGSLELFTVWDEDEEGGADAYYLASLSPDIIIPLMESLIELEKERGIQNKLIDKHFLSNIKKGMS